MSNDILKTAWGDLDVSKAPVYATQLGDGSTYGLGLTINGTEYKYVPADLIKKGGISSSSGNTYLFPWFTNKDNLTTFGQNASTVDLSNVGFANWLKNNGVDTQGYLVKASAAPFDSQVTTQPTSDLKGDLTGLKSYNGNVIYGLSGGHGNRYLTSTGEVHDPYTEYHSVLGDTFGSVGETLSGGINDVFGAVNSLGPLGTLAISVMNPIAGAAIAGANVGNAAATGNLEFQDLAKAAAMSYAAGQIADGLSSSTNTSTAPVTTPDYTAGANYGYTGNTGGLGLQASQGAGTNLYQAGSGGGLGLNANVGSLFGSLVNPFTGDILGNQLANLNTGADTLGNVNQASPNTNSNLQQSLLRTGIKAGLGSLFGGNTGTNNMATTANNNAALGNLLGGLLGGVGGLMQGSTNTAAMKEYANAITQAGNQAQAQAAFRPVGMTTSFGTSNFQIDPTTGQVTQAGYTLSPQLQAAQEGVLGGLRQNLTDAQTQAALGRSYLAQNPQDVASNWLSQQQALLAPSREQAWARLNQGNYNQGTTGLKVAQGGNLQSANPYASALANAQAQQDAQLAAQAQQQGQQAVTFGQGLLSKAYDPFNAGLTTSAAIEKLGQNPYGLSTDLANTVSQRGAVTGGLGLKAADAAAQAMKQANTYNPYASVLSGLGTSSTAGNVLGGLLGNTSLGTSLGNWLGNLNLNTNQFNQAMGDWFNANPDIVPTSTFNGSGSDYLDPETRALLGL